MKRSTTLVSMLIPTLLMIGCGAESETRRQTSNSPDLTGLWRLNLNTSQSGLSADANITFTLQDNGNEVSMVACAERESATLSRNGNTINGLPVGGTTVVNNDTLEASGNLGDSSASKMSTSARFDMGSFRISGGDLGSISTTNLCVQSDYASVLGQATQDRFSGTTILSGQPLTVDISRMGNLRVGTYDINRDMADGGVQIMLRSNALKARINRTEMNLRNGSLTITEDSDVWLKGNFSADMPNGQTVSGSFEFEKA